MSERWGDSQRDRDALDRHITGNYGEDQFKEGIAEPDDANLALLRKTISESLEWEPGTLPRRVLERVLQDALADMWQDCYRQSGETFQRSEFCQRVTAAIQAATGEQAGIWIGRPNR